LVGSVLPSGCCLLSPGVIVDDEDDEDEVEEEAADDEDDVRMDDSLMSSPRLIAATSLSVRPGSGSSFCCKSGLVRYAMSRAKAKRPKTRRLRKLRAPAWFLARCCSGCSNGSTNSLIALSVVLLSMLPPAVAPLLRLAEQEDDEDEDEDEDEEDDDDEVDAVDEGWGGAGTTS
jgi:hypothetical protein